MQNTILKAKIFEALSSVLPVAGIVLLLSLSLVPLPNSLFVSFLFGTAFLIFGMGLFTLGAETAMTPMGEYVGSSMTKSRKIWLIVFLSFFVGVMITISEPDLQVLAQNVPSVNSTLLLWTVAAGVGVFLVLAMLRILFSVKLRYLLIGFYAVAFLLAMFVEPDFWAVAFDAGGVTTGPMTVPFIMALGVGVSAIRSDRAEGSDSFGLVALCSIGPIISVLMLGLLCGTGTEDYVPFTVSVAEDSRSIGFSFLRAVPETCLEVAKSILPIAAFFLLYQRLAHQFQEPLNRRQLLKILIGIGYTFAGLVLFLTGVNVGFMQVGYYIGEAIASQPYRMIVVPIGMLLGYFIVSAEPAVHVLEAQVETVTAGAIQKKALAVTLAIGTAISVGLSLLRVLTGISIMWLIGPGYIIALVLSFFVPEIFTSIAFDSGGVASGPMTATFLLPLAMGVCSAVGGNIMTDAFGVVAMVAMTPLIAIEILGLEYRRKLSRNRIKQEQQNTGDVGVIEFHQNWKKGE